MMGCRSLSVRYSNGDWGIRDVTVDFAPGESTAVVGASGSGKSSLLNALLGLAPIVGGTVTFGSDRVDNLSSDAYATLRRRRFGVIFQQGLLLEELNVVDNAGLLSQLDQNFRDLEASYQREQESNAARAELEAELAALKGQPAPAGTN